MLLVTKLCFVFENSETVSFDIAAIQYYNRLSQCSHEQIKIHYNTLAKKTNLVCIWKTSKKWNQPKLCLKLNCDGNCSKQDIAWQLLMCIHSTSTDILVIFLIGSVQDVRQLDRMTAKQDRLIDLTLRRTCNMYRFITIFFQFAHK